MTKKNIFLIIILVLSAITLFFIVFQLLNQNISSNTKSTNNNVVNNQLPESYNAISYPNMNGGNINFKLKSSSTSSLNISSFISSEYSKKVSEGNVTISHLGFQLFVFAGEGTTGGLENSVAIEKAIENNNFTAPIYKVSSPKEYISDYTGDLDPIFTNFFFYSNDFKTGVDCKVLDTQYDGCGSQELSFTDKTSKYHLGIYCAAASDNASENCDEFVRNLKVNIE